MKKVKIIALLSAVCISAAALTGCIDIPAALMYASAPHISEDSELVTESMKIKTKFFNEEDVQFRSDKSVKSRAGKIDDIVNSGNYTSKTYTLCYDEDDTYVFFDKSIVSDNDAWVIDGDYYIDKNQNPIIDIKTDSGAYDEYIIKGGYDYYRYSTQNNFYMSPSGEGMYYDNISQNTPHEPVTTGKATIDGIEYDAEIIFYSDFSVEQVYDEYLSSYYEESEIYEIWIYDDEDNIIITYNISKSESEQSSISIHSLEYAVFWVYEDNDDNSDVIQKPKEYIDIYDVYDDDLDGISAVFVD